MKIERFNERIGFETWTKECVKDFVRKHEDFTTGVSGYIIWKEEIDTDEDDVFPNEYSISDNDIFVQYNDAKGNDLTFLIDDMEEFVNFLNDSELTKNAKNYNL